MDKKLSVIIPVYNEEEGIKIAVQGLVANISKVTADFEIVIVNDGSADKTASVVEDIIKEDSRVKMVQQWQNQGFGAAVLLGFANASNGLLLITPADNIIHSDELERMFELINSNDIVSGARRGRVDYGPIRKFCSDTLRFMVNTMFDLRLKDIGWVSMYRKDKLSRLNIKTEYEFTLGEILARAKHGKLKIAEIDVHYSPRTSGVHTGASIRAVLSTLRDMIKVRLDLWFRG